MPVLIAILAAIGGAIWWWMRNNPREAIDTAQDVAETIINAPRRLAFRSQVNKHPVEGIDDPRIAICAVAQAFIELDDLPSKEQRDRLHVMLRSKLRCDEEEAREMEILGRWLVGQCNSPVEAVPRLARRLRKLDDGSAWDTLQAILAPLVEGGQTPSQASAQDDLRVAFRK